MNYDVTAEPSVRGAARPASRRPRARAVHLLLVLTLLPAGGARGQRDYRREALERAYGGDSYWVDRTLRFEQQLRDEHQRQQDFSRSQNSRGGPRFGTSRNQTSDKGYAAYKGNPADAMLAQTFQFIEGGKFEDALVRVDLAVRLSSGDPFPLLVRGLLHQRLGNSERAAQDYAAGLKLVEDLSAPPELRAFVHFALCQAQNGAGQPRRALDSCDQAIRLNPKEVGYLVERGFARLELGDYDLAALDFSAGAAADPNDAVALYGLGSARMGLEKFKEAVGDFDVAVRINPNFVAAYLGRGASYIGLGEGERAIADYRRAASLAPNSAAVYYHLGGAYAKVGRRQEAVQELKRALKFDPKMPRAYFALGVTYGEMGDRESALKQHKALQKLDPELAGRLYAIINR